MIDILLYSVLAGNAASALLNAYYVLPLAFGGVSEIVIQIGKSLTQDPGWRVKDDTWINQHFDFGFFLSGDRYRISEGTKFFFGGPSIYRYPGEVIHKFNKAELRYLKKIIANRYLRNVLNARVELVSAELESPETKQLMEKN